MQQLGMNLFAQSAETIKIEDDSVARWGKIKNDSRQ